MASDKQFKIVETIELTKIFRDFWGRQRVKAVDGLNMSIGRGEIFGLLGPNGSGKTTTIRMLLGLLFPSRGVIRMFGGSQRDVATKKRIGYMPEESHLYQYLDADEILDFYARLFKLPPRERKKRVDYLIELVGLTKARKRPMREYSKGMARRIGLAQALINDPDLIILDEPTTGLDPIGTKEIKDLIVELKKRNKTILLSSHLLADVEDVCDRIAILYGGKQRALGTVTELLSDDEQVEIRTRRMRPETLEKVVALIRSGIEEESEVQVGRPKRRLEDFFMKVVEAARVDRLQTSGAEAGRLKDGFLLQGVDAGKETGGSALVDELVSAGQTAKLPETEPEFQAKPTKPRDMAPSETNEKVLGDLVKAPSGNEKPEGPDVEEGPVAPVETNVRRDVLDGLLDKPSEKEGNGNTDEASEQNEKA